MTAILQPIPNRSFSFPKEPDLEKICQYSFLTSIVPNSLWSCSKVPEVLLFWRKVRRSFQPEAGSSPTPAVLSVGPHAFPWAPRTNICCGLKCSWWEVVVDISAGSTIILWLLLRPNISMEKVGSTIISPDFSRGNASNACIGSRRRRGCLTVLLMLVIALFVLPALARVVWADVCFCNCCVAKESSQA